MPTKFSNAKKREARLGADLRAILDLCAERSAGKFENGSLQAAVRLLPNSELRRLKKEHLHKEQATVDVLAFPDDPRFPDPNREPGWLGEVFVNQGIALKSLKRARQLLIHGLLHLLGYRHDGKRDTIEMEKLETKIFSSLFIK